MMNEKGKCRMNKAEILELLALKGWSRTRLASNLDMVENTVQRWIMGDRVPSGPAAILMRMWLDEARARVAQQKTVKGNGSLAGAGS